MRAVALALVISTSIAAAEPPLAQPGIEQVPPDPNARAEAILATVLTAGIVGMGAYSVVKMKQTSDRADEIQASNGEPAEWTASQHATDHWFHMTLVFGGLTVVSAAVTGIMWSRTQPKFQAAVTPQGGFVGYSTSF